MPTVLLGAALLATLGLLLALRPGNRNAEAGDRDADGGNAVTARSLWLLAALVPLLWSLTAALLGPL